METEIRRLVQNLYDLQSQRIAIGNRIVASMHSEAEEAGDAEKAKVLKVVVSEYNRITDVYARQFNSRGSVEKSIRELSVDLKYTKTLTDYWIVQTYMQLLSTEKECEKALTYVVHRHPMWTVFFKDVCGCGPVMAGVCLAYLDPYKARHCSSFWKYAGLDVVYVPDKDKWEGRSRCHTELRPYTDKNGEEKMRNSLTFAPFLKTKLLGVLGPSFLRAGIRTVGDKKVTTGYARVYYDYRHRQDQFPNLTEAHKHRRALRYVVKIFLRDLWVAWRTYEGLTVTDPYEVAVLGHRPHHSDA